VDALAIRRSVEPFLRGAARMQAMWAMAQSPNALTGSRSVTPSSVSS